MKQLTLGVMAALMLSAGQAAADGLPSRGHIRGPAIEGAAPNWNGLYLGVGIGAGAASFVEDDDDPVNGHGAFGTVTVGYDREIRPGVVAGVFADFDYSGITAPNADDRTGLQHAWSIGGRLGYLENPATLMYATGGYTQARSDLGFGNIGGAHTFDGYFVGAGVETFLRQNWTLKLEYRLSHTQGTLPHEGQGHSHDYDIEEHSGRLVLSYRFGQRD